MENTSLPYIDDMYELDEAKRLILMEVREEDIESQLNQIPTVNVKERQKLQLNDIDVCDEIKVKVQIEQMKQSIENMEISLQVNPDIYNNQIEHLTAYESHIDSQIS